jgi:hypothetical protein
MKNMSPFEISKLLADISKATARRQLMQTERELNAAHTPLQSCTLENKHAAQVVSFRRLPSVTSPGTPDPQE